MLDLWLTVRTLVSKTVLSFWSPHLLLTTRMNAWAESSPLLAPALQLVIAGEVDVLPSERGEVLEQ